MWHRALISLLIIVLVGLAAPPVAAQQPVGKVLCAHREDRPDLGSPVHKTKGGRGDVQHRLKNGTGVTVLKTHGDWHYVRYNDPSPDGLARSEPLRFTGWIAGQYLRACPSAPTKERAEAEPVAHGDGDVKLCWFNAKRLGHGKHRDWDATARAVKGCNLVGLGEVMTQDAAIKLATTIGPRWKASTSEKSVGRKGYREWYAVVYDTDCVRLQQGLTGFYLDPGDRFEREPWAVTLKAGSFDFTLVLHHIVWGDSDAERIAELEQVDDVYRYYQDRDAHEDDVLLLGDFNRTPTQKGWDQVRQLGLRLLVSGKGSTIGTKGETANLYDQIIIDPRFTKEWTGKAGVMPSAGEKVEVYRKTVSDHLPVWAAFGTAGEDDD